MSINKPNNYEAKNKDLLTFNPDNDQIYVDGPHDSEINKLIDEGNEIRIYSDSVQSYKESPFVKPK